MVHLTKHFPWLHDLMNNVPLPIADRLDPDLAALVRVHKVFFPTLDLAFADLARVSKYKSTSSTPPTAMAKRSLSAWYSVRL